MSEAETSSSWIPVTGNGTSRYAPLAAEDTATLPAVAYNETTSVEVLLTVALVDDTRIVMTGFVQVDYRYGDGPDEYRWLLSRYGGDDISGRVVAWQPYPEPYAKG